MCGVRRFASSPSSSGMLDRVYHLVVHFQKLHCKENEEVIVGFYTKPPMGGYVAHNKISESINQSYGHDAIYCSIVFSLYINMSEVGVASIDSPCMDNKCVSASLMCQGTFVNTDNISCPEVRSMRVFSSIRIWSASAILLVKSSYPTNLSLAFVGCEV